MLRFWSPVVLMMILIFIASTALFSGSETSRFIRPFLEWILPGQNESTYHQVHLLIRKLGHLTEYAFLAALTWRAFRHQLDDNGTVILRSINRPFIAMVVVVPAIYAITDEWHQSLTATRMGSPIDVMIDTGGAMVGTAICWSLSKVRLRRVQIAQA